MEQWQRFLKYRNKKIVQEEEVRKMHYHLTEMTTYLDELVAVDDDNRKQIATTLRALTGRGDIPWHPFIDAHILSGL